MSCSEGGALIANHPTNALSLTQFTCHRTASQFYLHLKIEATTVDHSFPVISFHLGFINQIFVLLCQKGSSLSNLETLIKNFVLTFAGTVLILKCQNQSW